MADKGERLHSLGRSEAAVHQRNAQLKGWQSSETNKQPSFILPSRKSPRVKFEDCVVFLAAAQSGDLEEVERLATEEGADVNSVNKDGLTALHQCCIDDDFDMVQKLVKLGAQVDIQDNEGWTPLHAAASCGHEHIVRYLLDHGAFPAPVNNEGDTPCDLAEDYEDIKNIIEREVKTQGVDIDAVRNLEEDVMLEDANKLVNDPTMPALISNGGATPLHIAAAKNYDKVVKVLLSLKPSQVDIDAEDEDGWTPLHAAVYWGNAEIAEDLVDHGADVNKKTELGEGIEDLCDPEYDDMLESLRKRTEEHNNRHRKNSISSRPHGRPSLTSQPSRDDGKPSPHLKRRPSRERSLFPKMDMAKEKEDLEKWNTDSTENETNAIMAESSTKNSTRNTRNVTNAMLTESSNKTVEVAVPASENTGPASRVIDNQTVAEARDMAVEDTNSSKEALNHAKESSAVNSAFVGESPPLSLASSDSGSNESIPSGPKKTVTSKLTSSPKSGRKRPGMSPQMMKRLTLWEAQSTTSSATPTIASTTNSLANTPTPIMSSTPSSSGNISSVSVNNDHSPSSSSNAAGTSSAATKRFSFQPRTIPQEPTGMRFTRSSSMDQRPSSAKTSLGLVGRRSTLNTGGEEKEREKRVSYDETRLRRNLDVSENGGSLPKTASLPRGTKIGNLSTDGVSSSSSSSAASEATERHRKTDLNVSSEGAATANSLTTEPSGRRDYSREFSEESETSRRSRARRTRQSRQATQPVPLDILERIKKHDEEVSRSEDSSDSSSSTPPQKRRDDEKPAPTMSAYKPSARPASKVLNQLPSQQMLWSMPASKKKEPAATEPPPKEKEAEPPKTQPTASAADTSTANVSRSGLPDVSISLDVTDYSSMGDTSDDKLSQSRTRGTSVARRRPREKRKPTGIIFEKGVNEELPENLKDIFGRKTSDMSTISDHSAQSSISEPDDDGLPSEELTRVLGLLSEEQAKSRGLQEKISSMEKKIEESKDLEKEVEKLRSKVSELNRRFEDANRAYEQEKKEVGQKEARINELESSSKNLQDLKHENQRLKDENSALIRVIGKLSRAPITHHNT